VPCTRFQEIDVAEFAVDPRAPEWAEFRDHFPRCAECSREVARLGALAAALGTEHAGTSAHPSDAKLFALARAPSGLPRDERALLETHLAGCAPCRTELAAARSFAFAAAPAPAGRRRWLDGLRMAIVPLVAAALVVAVLVPAAFFVWRQGRETRPVAVPPTAEVERSAPVPVAEAPPEVDVPEPTRQPTQIAEQPEETKPAPIVKPPVAPEAPAASPPEPAPAPIQIAALVPSEPPLYAPDSLASGASVRVGGEARSLGADVPVPEALGPAHVGASTHESPNLYWFLPASTSSTVEVTVIDPGAADPVLETTTQGRLEAGVHRVSLAEHGARLRAGTEYRWYVALVRDPARRSQDVVSEAAIRYMPPGPELGNRLSAAPPASAAHVYAESGFWYDAFDQLSAWLATEPGAAVLHQHRASLLDQAGLPSAAAYERHHASGE
jgi:hypothetical protein